MSKMSKAEAMLVKALVALHNEELLKECKKDTKNIRLMGGRIKDMKQPEPWWVVVNCFDCKEEMAVGKETAALQKKFKHAKYICFTCAKPIMEKEIAEQKKKELSKVNYIG